MTENEKLTQEKLTAKLDEWFATVADYGEVEDQQAYNQIKEMIQNYIDADEMLNKVGLKIAKDGSLIQQKPTVNPDHALAKLIDTLGWKLSHFPHARECFTDVRISRKEYQEIKDFVEVVEK